MWLVIDLWAVNSLAIDLAVDLLAIDSLAIDLSIDSVAVCSFIDLAVVYSVDSSIDSALLLIRSLLIRLWFLIRRLLIRLMMIHPQCGCETTKKQQQQQQQAGYSIAASST